MAAYIVRHAKAGDREEWEGDDRLRPLTKAGHRQAQALAESLRNERIDKILSSPYVRCMQTVEPLAAKLKLPIEPRKDLEEGAGGESVIRIMHEFKGRNIVLCTHGDVVEALLGQEAPKGSTWALEVDGVRVRPDLYLPPPA
jgi:broad specificity phosphatase PhoE